MDVKMADERQRKIDELEAAGLFDRDIEDDPPSREILPDEIEYIKKTPWQKIKTKFAFFLAYRFAARAVFRRYDLYSEAYTIYSPHQPNYPIGGRLYIYFSIRYSRHKRVFSPPSVQDLSSRTRDMNGYEDRDQ